MAKKKNDTLTDDEQREQDTLEANVVAEESEATPPEVVAEVAQPSKPAEFVLADDGVHMVATDPKARQRIVTIGDARYEHVAETPDGCWTYARS